MFLFLRLVILLLVEKSCGNILECHTDFNCSAKDILFSNGSIECYGDHSCFESNVVIDTTPFEYTSITRYDLDCSASYSCFNTSCLTIISRNSNGIYINCLGLYSCASSQRISFEIINKTNTPPTKEIRCYGE